MSIKFPTYSRSARHGEMGVNIVSRIILDRFGWLFRRNPQEHDFGIDGQIEVVTEAGAVTGQLLAVQIKCGKSFFRERTKWGFVYRGETKHFNYLANYPIPVVLCICDPESKEAYWVNFQAAQAESTDCGWKITVPFENTLSSSKIQLMKLLPVVEDSFENLKYYWELNKVLSNSDLIFFGLDNLDVNSCNIERARTFFDRLRSTKPLASSCCGKVEIFFDGYNDDTRELFQIDEVRHYVCLLDIALPELFFFVRNQPPTFTLLTFALCQVSIPDEIQQTSFSDKLSVKINPGQMVAFLERHYVGLNEMTDWLGMTTAENEKISSAVRVSLGINQDTESNK